MITDIPDPEERLHLLTPEERERYLQAKVEVSIDTLRGFQSRIGEVIGEIDDLLNDVRIKFGVLEAAERPAK
jgi:hypothetical protein